MKARFVLLACLLTSLGCAADLTQPWEVKEPRPLGVRIEVEGRAESSRPKPGEYFTLRQFVALPKKPAQADLDKRYSYALVLCLGFQLPNGQLACQAEIPLDGVIPGADPAKKVTVQAVSDDEIEVSNLFVPPFEAPAGSDVTFDRLSLFGALCVDGKVERVPGKSVKTDPVSKLFRCAGKADAEFPAPASFTLSVLLDLDRAGDANLNPTFSCAEAASKDACKVGVKQDDEKVVPGEIVLVLPRPEGAPDTKPREQVVWEPLDPASGLPWDDCASRKDIRKVAVGAKTHLIRVRSKAKDREPYEYDTVEYSKKVHKKTREESLYAHALTDESGKLARYFSVIDKDVPDAEAEIELEYKPPSRSSKAGKSLAQTGRLVRVYFVLRDERGGVDYTSRELCLVPAAARE